MRASSTKSMRALARTSRGRLPSGASRGVAPRGKRHAAAHRGACQWVSRVIGRAACLATPASPSDHLARWPPLLRPTPSEPYQGRAAWLAPTLRHLTERSLWSVCGFVPGTAHAHADVERHVHLHGPAHLAT